MKDAVRGRKFESADNVVSTVRTWLRQKVKEWHQSGIHALVPRWRKAIELPGEFVEN